MEAGMSVGGVGFSASVGVTGGSSYSFTMAKDTTYTGSIGALYNTDYYYSTGMLVKTVQHPDKAGVKFQLIDFWATDYDSGLACP